MRRNRSPETHEKPGKPGRSESRERSGSKDPRAARVRAGLKEAALELAHEQRGDEISVRQITERAGVSRQVFYLHFHDRDEAITTAVADSLAEALPRDTGSKEEALALIHRFLGFTTGHVALYTNLYRSSASEQVATAARTLLHPACVILARSVLGDSSAADPAVRDRDTWREQALTTLLVGGVMEVSRRWVEARTGDHADIDPAIAHQMLDDCLRLLLGDAPPRDV